MVYARVKYNNVWQDSIPVFYKNDYGQELVFKILEDDGSEVDLTDYTVTVKAKKLNDYDEYLFSESCVITDASNGEATYTAAINNMDTVGTYLFLIELVKTNYKEYINMGYLDVKDS